MRGHQIPKFKIFNYAGVSCILHTNLNSKASPNINHSRPPLPGILTTLQLQYASLLSLLLKLKHSLQTLILAPHETSKMNRNGIFTPYLPVDI